MSNKCIAYNYFITDDQSHAYNNELVSALRTLSIIPAVPKFAKR